MYQTVVTLAVAKKKGKETGEILPHPFFLKYSCAVPCESSEGSMFCRRIGDLIGKFVNLEYQLDVLNAFLEAAMVETCFDLAIVPCKKTKLFGVMRSVSTRPSS